MNRLIAVCLTLSLGIASLAYPIIWLWQAFYATGESPLLLYLPYVMACLWAGKAFLQWRTGRKPNRQQAYFSFLMAIVLAMVGITRSVETMYWYPVLINGVMLSLFGSSLFSSQTLVERLARMQTPDLSPQGIAYTRAVTQLWCGVFILNMLIASGLILGGYYHAWAIFTGVISYVIIGVVMAAEWLVRQKVKKAHAVQQ